MCPKCLCCCHAASVRHHKSVLSHHMDVTRDADPIWLYSHWVKLCAGLECVHMSAASPVWRRRGQPCQRSSWGTTVLSSPTRDAWALCFRSSLPRCETRGDSDRSIWDTAVPCRIKQAVSQGPLTGNLTQITKGSADWSWHVHAFSLGCNIFVSSGSLVCRHLYFHVWMLEQANLVLSSPLLS